MTTRWKTLSRQRQRWVVAVAVVVGVFVVLGGLNSLGRRPGGPTLSSYATGNDGLAAFDALLARNAHPTRQLRVALDKAQLSPNDTAVVLGQIPAGGERRALRAFVRDGGRLVTGGPEAESFLRSIVADLRWHADGHRRLRVAQPTVEGLRAVDAAGLGSWSGASGSPLFSGDARDAGFELRYGEGTLVALADPSPLMNGLLAKADNAAFAVQVAGEDARPVAFAENGHGYGLSDGLAAIPPRWKAALWFAAVAALVGALAAGKRFGPVDVEPEAPAPERTRYVGAVASTLARARDRDAAAAPLRARGIAYVTRRAGYRTDAEDLLIAAQAAGLTEAEARCLIDPVLADADLVALGRTVSRLEEH
jgi:hypothetical protein